MIKSIIFKNRYQAGKARKSNPFFTGDEMIVRVCGGYALIDRANYRTWRRQ